MSVEPRFDPATKKLLRKVYPLSGSAINRKGPKILWRCASPNRVALRPDVAREVVTGNDHAGV
jgi:hypothetical protein